MSENQSVENVWSRNSKEAEKRGELFSEREKLNSVFSTIRSFDHLPDGFISSEENLMSDFCTFDMTRSRVKSRYETTARQTITNDIHIAVRERPSNKKDGIEIDHDFDQYIINSNGTVVSVDELSNSLDPSTPTDAEIAIIKKAASVISQKASNRIYDYNYEKRRKQDDLKERRSHIKRRIAAGAITLVSIAGVGAGGYFAWNEWIYKPGQVDDAYREEFDEDGYSIDGQSIELKSQQVNTIPTDEFEQIPKFRGGDTLEHPRIASINSASNCAELSLDSSPASITVAVSEYNPLGALPIVSYFNEGKLTICTIGDISELTPDQTKIAVQINTED